MEQRELTDEQYKALVDYLHRWGLDSPELISEMADHFAEKALELMDRGHKWEQVLNSFKTKATYSRLRRLEAEYKRVWGKTWIRKVFGEMRRSAELSVLVPIALFAAVVYYALQVSRLLPYFENAIAIKAIAVIGVMTYFTNFNRRTKVMLKTRNFFPLLVLEIVIAQSIITQRISPPPDAVGAEPLSDGLVWMLTGFVAVSLYLNVVTYRLMRSTHREAKDIHTEIFQKLNAG